ncbi:hypothetical protein KO465_04610 [Candidatus Micrarchaeota archaeon]|nr:hypothetical protein [Candidatus Micrarchaeota archaeon]
MPGHKKVQQKLSTVLLLLIFCLVLFLPVIPAAAEGEPVFTITPASRSSASLLEGEQPGQTRKNVMINSGQDELFNIDTSYYVVLKKDVSLSDVYEAEYLSNNEIMFSPSSTLVEGSYDVFVNHPNAPGGQYDTGKTFTVGDPSVTLTPSSVANNYSQAVTINVTGINTNFADSQTQVMVMSGTNYASSFNVTDAGTMTFLLGTGLPAGSYDVAFVTTIPGGNEEFTLTNALTVRGEPSISISPSSLVEGYSAATVTVNGTNTGFNGTTVKVLDAGGEPTGKAGTPNVESATKLTFVVGTGLTAGSYTVRVTSGDEVADAVLTVGSASAVLKLTDSGTDFTGLNEGYTTSRNLTLAGTNTSFGGTTQLKLFKGETEITGKITNETVQSVTSLTFTLATGLTGGEYTVRATTGAQVVTASFTVRTPALTSVTFSSPIAVGSVIPQGYQQFSVSVVGENTLFVNRTSNITLMKGDQAVTGKISAINRADNTSMSFNLESGLEPGSDYQLVIDDLSFGLTYGFTVTEPGFAISPASFVNVSSDPLTINVTGTNTHFNLQDVTPTVTIRDSGDQIVGMVSGVENIDNDPTKLRFRVIPNSIDNPGSYTITIRTNKASVLDESITETDILTVTACGIGSISPSVVYTDRLGVDDITVNGNSTNFTAQTRVQLQKDGLDVGSLITPTIMTTATLKFTVPAGLETGTYTLKVIESTGGAEYSTTFQVQARSITLSSTSKTFGYEAFVMTVTGSGVAFDSGVNLPTIKILDAGGSQADQGLTPENILTGSFTFNFPVGLPGGHYTVQVTFQDAGTTYSGITLTKSFVVIQAAPELQDVTVTDPSGAANNGKLLVTDGRADKTNPLMYRVSATSPDTPNIGDPADTYTELPQDGLITADSGEYTSVIEAAGTPAYIIAFKSFQVDPALSPPAYQGASLNSTNTVATLSFDVTLADNTGGALKAAVSFAADGTNFVALGNNDAVEIQGANLVVTFEQALAGSLNKLRVAADALADAAFPAAVLNVLTETESLTAADISPPVYQRAYLTSDRVKLTLVFNEPPVNNLADGNALKAAVTFAADGTNYAFLAAGDAVSLEDNKLIVTFAQELQGDNNSLKVAANSLKDAAGNVLTEDVVTGPVSVDDCFIATAAYGSYLHPRVQVLRDFRDDVLLKTVPGRYLVDAYYHYSPPLAAYIASHDLLRAVVRIILAPLVFAVANPLLFFAALVLAMGALACAVRRLVSGYRKRSNGRFLCKKEMD